MRIVHLSDPHIFSPVEVEVSRLVLDKRITGYANVLLRRARIYRREYLMAVLDAVARVATRRTSRSSASSGRQNGSGQL